MSGLLTRRNILIAGGAGVLVAGTGIYQARADRFSGAELTPPEVHAQAVAGDVVLVDIRRPDEWEKTGIGEGAYPLDMRRDDFVAELTKLTGGKTDTPVALICARGVRSDRMSQRLAEAGFTQIIDVPEGMLGSRAGPGWLKRDLPTKAPDA